MLRLNGKFDPISLRHLGADGGGVNTKMTFCDSRDILVWENGRRQRRLVLAWSWLVFHLSTM